MVSVVMPAHKYVPEVLDSIHSVLQQTKYLKELIVVDDSGEGSVVSQIAANISDPRLKLLSNEVNLGSGPSRNRGVAVSTGEYLAFCDADDLWLPHKLQAQIEFMLAHKVFFTFSSYTAFDHLSAKDLYTVKCDKPLGLFDFVKNTLICTSTVVLDKRVFDGQVYFPPIRTSQDTACWLGLLKTGVKAVPQDQVLVRYREGNQKATANKRSAAFDYYRLIRVALQLSPIRAFYYFLWYGFNAVKKRMN